MKRYTLIISLLVLCLAGSAAQTTESVEVVQKAVPDSVLLQREKEIVSEYGFKDSNTLAEVAHRLLIADIDQWKRYLGLEPANKKLDNMSLDRLGIAPYRALLAQQYSVFGFTELSTLSEAAAAKNMPIKKLKQMLGLTDINSRKWDGMSLQALDFTPQQIEKMHQDFTDNSLSYGVNVTLVGMLTVFLALLITSMVISQLIHLNRVPKKKQADIVLDSKGKLKSSSVTLNKDIIVAAIAALHIHQQSIEDRRKLALTFRRTPTNQWRASAVLSMPNREMGSKRR